MPNLGRTQAARPSLGAFKRKYSAAIPEFYSFVCSIKNTHELGSPAQRHVRDSPSSRRLDMSFRRDDFHNSRTYEADAPTPAPGGFSSAIAWVKRQFDKLLQSGASPSISAFNGDEGPYSRLGSDGRDRSSGKLDSSVFPMTDRDPGFQTRLRPAKANGVRRHEQRPER